METPINNFHADIKLPMGDFDLAVKLTNHFLFQRDCMHGIDLYEKGYFHHAHSDYEIQYISAGTGEVRIADQSFSFSKGDIVITAPQVMHYYCAGPEGCARLAFRFSIGEGNKTQADIGIRSLLGIFGSINNSIVLRDEGGSVFSCMTTLQNEIMHKKLGWVEKLKAGFVSMLIDIARLAASGGEHKEESLPVEMRADRPLLIEDFFWESSNRFMSKAELADRLGFSPRQLERSLCKYYGKTFSQIALQNRMETADNYITKSKMSLSDIAEKVGYSSVNAFYRAFKRYYGMPPGEKRKG